MRIVSRIILLAVLVAAGVWVWSLLFPSPQKVIHKRLAQIAGEASFTSGQNPLVMAARCENLGHRFSTNAVVSVNAPEYGLRVELAGREEITQAAAGASTHLSGLKVAFPDVSVTVAPDKQSAVADVAMEVKVAGEKDFNVQEVKFTFRKIDGDWLITRVENVRAPS